MAAPRPIAIHKLAGTYRKDRHGGGADFDPGGRPVKPEGLDGDAGAFWDRCIEPLATNGVATGTDQAACESAAFWWGELIRVQAALSAADPTGDGYYRLAVLAATCQKQFNAIAWRLGLSPVDRRNVRTPLPGKSKLASRYIDRGDRDVSRFFHGDHE